MKDYIFLFDLDSTITKQEILPNISKIVGKQNEMRELTERTMNGELPFKQSFLSRIDLLKDIPVSKVQDLIEQIPVHEELVRFMNDNKNQCYIVTGNLDIWISKLLKKIGMENNCYCSSARVEDDKIVEVTNVIDKANVDSWFKKKLVVVGDGNNDADMISKAEIGIGFGAVRPIAPAVLECATHAIYDEHKLYTFLNDINRWKLWLLTKL